MGDNNSEIFEDEYEDSRVRISVRAWQQVMAQNRAAHERRDAEVRKAQFDLCRELILARGDISDIGWFSFRKTLTAEDRERMFLVGFDSLACLEGEFYGEQADLERKARSNKRAQAMIDEKEHREKLNTERDRVQNQKMVDELLVEYQKKVEVELKETSDVV